MSDIIVMSITAGRKYIQDEIDRLRKYFDKIGYTVTQFSVNEQSQNGTVKKIQGSIQAKSPDDFTYRYSTEIPVCKGGVETREPNGMLVSFYPDIDDVVPI